jgi:colanic acid biosynthesis glycosyl transferase WcaI
MAKILLLTLVFPPDSVSTAHLLGDLAEDLTNLGHDVKVITAIPHYNKDVESEISQLLIPFIGKIIQISKFRFLDVYHIWVPDKSCGKAKKLFGWLIFHIITLFLGLLPRFKSDIVLSTSPPLSIGLCGAFLAKVYKGKSVYNIWELFPEVAVHMRIIKNSYIISLLRKLESYVYRLNDHLCTLGKCMAQKVIESGVRRNKVSIIPTAADINGFLPMERSNLFSKAYRLDEKFVVGYAGNLGKPQGLKTFVLAANQLRNRNDILFLMIGDGSEKKHLLKLASDFNLTNYKYIGYQPYSKMPQIYAACDLCLVAQMNGIGALAMPSKIYKIMASKRPVLAMGDPDGDLAKFVQHEKVGLYVEPDNHTAMANSIIWAVENPLKLSAMSTNGRRIVCGQFSRTKIAELYTEIFSSLKKN